MGVVTPSPVVLRNARSATAPCVVLLHGFMGMVEDLAPFATSMGADADFVVPHGIVDLAPRGLRGRAWWPTDVDARAAEMARGPRDLSGFFPDGLDAARHWLDGFLRDFANEWEHRPLVVGGFSQGAMLACDLALRTPRRLSGVVLFSGARIAATTWRPLYRTRAGLPALMSHGRRDDDLAFTAAESFQTELVAAGWDVQWCPFDGGHEVPLQVWRTFKRWLASLSSRSRSS